MLKKLLTKNQSKIPVLWIYFNLKKYIKHGKENSCTICLHPNLKKDKYVAETLNGLVDYIRSNYDMQKF